MGRAHRRQATGMRPEELGFGRLFGRVRDAVVVADAKTQRIVLWNPAAESMFGYSTSEALKLLELLRRTVEESRRVIEGLRPAALDDLGLAVALGLLVEELRSDGWRVDYREDLGTERLAKEAETALYRVAQEALASARKHARTARARVRLERRGERIRLEVRDFGRGFDPSATSHGGGPGEKVGISGMRERITLLGGDFELRSRPGEGTSVAAEIPLPPAKGTGP